MKCTNKILDKYTFSRVLVYGNEQRESFNFKHPRLKINNWISHKNLLKVYESSISVVNPTWESLWSYCFRKCLKMCSNNIKSGLSETFKNNYV